MPTWMDFGLKNPPKSPLGRLLGRLVAVLGGLGPSWRALETCWRLLEASWSVLGAPGIPRSSKKLEKNNQ